MQNAVCTGDWSFISLRPEIPAELLSHALANPGAISLAYQHGALELVALVLAVFGLALTVLGVVGFWFVRREAMAIAQETAAAKTPKAVEIFMRDHGEDLIKACLLRPELLSLMQQSIHGLGLDYAQQGHSVESGEDEAGGSDGGYHQPA